MITVSKGRSPPVLAQGWMNDLGTRPAIRISWEGLWECKARNNPCNHDLGVLTPKS